MKRMKTSELRDYYEVVCSEPPRSRNRDWLVKKIAWRLQANEEGGLPERVRQRALAMADDADLRKRPSQQFRKTIEVASDHTLAIDAGRDPRLPPVDSILSKKYKGQMLTVRIRQDGFEFNGELFATLSAIANSITGSHVNGFTFFKLNSKKEVAQ